MQDEQMELCPSFAALVTASVGEPVLAVSGEVDLAAAPTLTNLVGELCAGAPGRVVIDAGGVTFIDAAGLRGLLGAYEPAALARIRVRRPSPPLLLLLELVGMTHLVHR